MKILITGVTGFLGSNFAKYFHKLGHDVVGLARSEYPSDELKAFLTHYISTDISRSIPKIDCDVCIHCAAIVGDHDSLDAMRKVNVDGTKNILESCSSTIPFIHISSPSVYEESDVPHSEDELIQGKNLYDYGRSKLEAEEYLENLDRRGNIFVIRPRAVYGIGDQTLLPRILNLGRSKRIILPGKINSLVSMTHIDNLVGLIPKLLHFEQAGIYEIYNVADDRTYDLGNVMIRINKAYWGENKKVLFLPYIPILLVAWILKILKIKSNFTPQSLSYVRNNCILNLEKVKKDLNYEPKRFFYESLSEILDWYKKTQ